MATSQKLVIVESPAKAKTVFRTWLSNGVRVGVITSVLSSNPDFSRSDAAIIFFIGRGLFNLILMAKSKQLKYPINTNKNSNINNKTLAFQTYFS